MNQYNFPVYGTQGGGLVRWVGGPDYRTGYYIFVEAPKCPGLGIGDKMPEEWDLIPANDKAMAEMEADCIAQDIE